MSSPSRSGPLPWLKPAIIVGALTPLPVMGWQAASGQLGANPIAEALNRLGLLALVFLVASLACTPLKRLVGWTWPMRLRRSLGLLSFGYAVLHLAMYAAVDQGLDLTAVTADILKRRFIFVGFAAFALLVPLAATSTNASVRRLGYPRWKRLHRLAYVAGALALLHFTWRVKKDLTEPLTYGAVLAFLLATRVAAAVGERSGIRSAPAAGGGARPEVPAPARSSRGTGSDMPARV